MTENTATSNVYIVMIRDTYARHISTIETIFDSDEKARDYISEQVSLFTGKLFPSDFYILTKKVR